MVYCLIYYGCRQSAIRARTIQFITAVRVQYNCCKYCVKNISFFYCSNFAVHCNYCVQNTTVDCSYCTFTAVSKLPYFFVRDYYNQGIIFTPQAELPCYLAVLIPFSNQTVREDAGSVVHGCPTGPSHSGAVLHTGSLTCARIHLCCESS